jgi:hypothetical protein
MDTYQKYFVSQHFGKSLSTVELGAETGNVTLALSRPESAKVKFSFHITRLSPFISDVKQFPEMVTRIAIQQAHKLLSLRGVHGLEGAHELALETSPWIGDLTEVPYGGATSGYDNLHAEVQVSQAVGATAPAPG